MSGLALPETAKFRAASRAVAILDVPTAAAFQAQVSAIAWGTSVIGHGIGSYVETLDGMHMDARVSIQLLFGVDQLQQAAHTILRANRVFRTIYAHHIAAGESRARWVKHGADFFSES